jgi:hypothetical protein
MQNDGDKTAPYNFSNSDPRQAMHSKDAFKTPGSPRQAAKMPGTALVPVGSVFDTDEDPTQALIRQHKFGTIFLAGLMGFAIGAALSR